MTATRRQVLQVGGGLLATLAFPPAAVSAQGVVEIQMQGRPDGSKVWFDPIGIRIEPGQTVRWTNRNRGNSHTSTAYHPANFGRPRRIPEGAMPWDSGYLLPDEAFSVALSQPGVYDFYCIPHELAGMVGRIVVGAPQPHGWLTDPKETGADGALPAAALNAFPPVEEIMRKGIVRGV